MMTDEIPVNGDHSRRRIAVDFDNTLTTGDCRYWAGERADPDWDVIEWVKEQYHDGKTVIVWTARPWSQANVIAARLTEWELPYHGIRAEKGSADLYVEDKGVRPQEVVSDG